MTVERDRITGLCNYGIGLGLMHLKKPDYIPYETHLGYSLFWDLSYNLHASPEFLADDEILKKLEDLRKALEPVIQKLAEDDPAVGWEALEHIFGWCWERYGVGDKAPKGWFWLRDWPEVFMSAQQKLDWRDFIKNKGYQRLP